MSFYGYICYMLLFGWCQHVRCYPLYGYALGNTEICTLPYKTTTISYYVKKYNELVALSIRFQYKHFLNYRSYFNRLKTDTRVESLHFTTA